MRFLIHVPLESYVERYTSQLSTWLHTKWKAAGIPFRAVPGVLLNDTGVIKTGCALDACGRGYWACSQVMALLKMLDRGEINDNDVIYFDDFWHPGIEALRYAFDLRSATQRPKMFAMLHAQSVDVYDFTYAMRDWIRPFEIGNAAILDGVFVSSTILKNLVCENMDARERVWVAGHPFDSDEIRSRFPSTLPKRKKQVVFSSRWDWEKRPEFFIDVVRYITVKLCRKDIRFVICTSAPKLRSNNPRLLEMLSDALSELGCVLELREALSKNQYYETLLESTVQFTCSLQDWVSYALLEACVCGCIPCYPFFRSFPEVIKDQRLLYTYSDYSLNSAQYDQCVHSASRLICDMIDRRNKYPASFENIYSPFDHSWERMMKVMKGEAQPNENLGLYPN